MQWLDRIMVAAITLVVAATAGAQSLPEVHGTIRAKYEYEPQISEGRYEVRNARLSVVGSILDPLTYKAEIDLCDEGSIKMLDAYVRYTPVKPLQLTLGQMRVPFGIDAHRSPAEQYFANRSFIAKQVGNVRDVGLAGAYAFKFPLTLQVGLFNGSGLTRQKDYWTGNYCLSAKVVYVIERAVGLEVSMQKCRPSTTDMYEYDCAAWYEGRGWHVEFEYLRKHYSRGRFASVNAIDAFVCKTFSLRWNHAPWWQVLVRYDYMGDHSDGSAFDDDGILTMSDPERHRITGGLNLNLGGAMRPRAQLRLNYEKYFYADYSLASISGRDKVVVEMMVTF